MVTSESAFHLMFAFAIGCINLLVSLTGQLPNYCSKYNNLCNKTLPDSSSSVSDENKRTLLSPFTGHFTLNVL